MSFQSRELPGRYKVLSKRRRPTVRVLGCGLGQGDLFSPPLPNDGVVRLLRTGTAADGVLAIPAARSLAA